ncbi:hypothetical protein KC19_2G272600 [Ceratodon purpureus]|uniref:Uncharacterized protein n=1 Tax=Ceratodon purpureus TaxID=3225 RepID=A0A8T0J1T3_CERPU|nr:hypothetical protein KC19_2G272600 [Ceratodon purpureus]
MSRIGEGFGRLEVLLTSVQCTKAVVFAGSCCMFRSERLYLTMRAVSFPCTQMLHQESLLTVVLRTTRCPAFEQINFRRAPNCAMQGIIRIQLSSYSGVRCGHQWVQAACDAGLEPHGNRRLPREEVLGEQKHHQRSTWITDKSSVTMVPRLFMYFTG